LDLKRRRGELTTRSTRSDEGRVERTGDLNREPRLVIHLLRNRKNHRLGRRRSRLGSSQSNGSGDGIVVSLVDVDADVRLLLDLDDLGTSLAKDTGERLDGDGEDDDVAVLLLVLDEVDQLLLCSRCARLPSANRDLVGVARLVVGVVGVLAVLGEVDTDAVVRLESLEVGPLFPDERSTLERRREEDGESHFVDLRTNVVSSIPRSDGGLSGRTSFSTTAMILFLASSTFSLRPLIVTLLLTAFFLELAAAAAAPSSSKSTRTPRSSRSLLAPAPALPTIWGRRSVSTVHSRMRRDGYVRVGHGRCQSQTRWSTHAPSVHEDRRMGRGRT
jgi:hypothetical protein